MTFIPIWFTRGGSRQRPESCRLRGMARHASCRLRSRARTAPHRQVPTMPAGRSSKWCCAMAAFCGYRIAWRRDAPLCWPMRWKAARDDPDAGGNADLGRLRDHGHEERIRWPGHAGAGRAEEVRAFGPPVRVPRQASRSHQDTVVGRHRLVSLCQAAGAWPVCLAADARGRREPDAGAIVDAVRGHRLACTGAHRCHATRRLMRRAARDLSTRHYVQWIAFGESHDVARMTSKRATLSRNAGSLQRMLAEKEALLDERQRIIAEKETQLAERDRLIAVRDAELYAKTLQIEHLKAQLAVLRRARFGRSSEKLDREIEQLELLLGELEESVAESNARTEQAKKDPASPARTKPTDRKPGGRKPLPAHLPREQVIHLPAPVCACCGGKVLRKIADELTEVLEYVPSSSKVMQHVRPKLSCRACETIVQAPLPSFPIERGRPGPGLLAHVARSDDDTSELQS